MKLTLKSQAAIMATAISVALVGLFGLSQREPIRREVMRQIKSQQTALVRESADDLRQRLDTYLGLLERTARQTSTVCFGTPAQEAAFFASIAPTAGLFDSVFLASTDGKVTAVSPHREGVIGIDIADRDYFKQVMVVDQPTISAPLRNRIGGEPVVTFAAPVHDRDGHIVGLIGAGLYLLKPNFLGDLRDMRIGETGRVYLVARGSNPIFIVHPAADKMLAPLDADPAIASAFRADPAALPEWGEDVVTTQDVIATGWTLAAVLPAEEANRQLNAMRDRFRWSLLALAALIGVSVWAAMLWLLRPLGHLHAAMTQLSATDLREIRPVELPGASAEIEAVSTAFRKLMDEVVRQRAELEAVNDASPLGLFRCDAAGRLVYANEACRRLLGFSHDEAMIDAWLERLHPRDREAVMAGWADAVARGTGHCAELRVTVPGHDERLLVVNTAPVRVEGRVVGHVGAMEDITVRAHAEQASRVLTQILDSTTDFVAQTDVQGRVTYINPAGRRFAGVALDADVRGSLVDAFYPDDTMQWLREVAVPTAVRDGVWIGETTVFDAQRRVVPINHMLIVHRDPVGQVEYFSSIMRDITQDKAAKEALQRSRETLQTVTDAMPALVAFVDADERYRFLNAAYEKAFDRPTAAMLGLTAREVLGEEAYAIVRGPLQRALAGETVVFEREAPGRDPYRCEEITYIPQFDARGRVAGVHAVMLDITERKKQELRLRALSTTDHLTGLLNRAGFEERLSAALAQAASEGTAGALLLLDLDGFKVVNDTYGHAAGDALLRTFAQRLARAVRPCDGVARFGGDEFVVILERLAQPDDAKAVAHHILAACNRPFRLGEIAVRVGASIGIARFDAGTLAQSAVFEAADEALYEAKSRGKGLFVAFDELSAGSSGTG
ncbi:MULTISPECIES: sensor domain-containing diguanylate cyclase [Ralstonia solanacearum species complex]|nr:diguanylate cyclase [Ralstonia solanacearum]ALF89533.1 putative diguanylate cyclase YegE [Ralstonia solanacearum]ATI29063.1 diguanylate cyclase [Ralstonia solanacearum]EAP70829.1 Sensor protein [Ralstonia solanacearum UW551]KEI32718.1 diguanylate cyclase [Ralstonia solanacearum]KFX84460.1 diguanylate cyclase [Ralstonia solanacearum]